MWEYKYSKDKWSIHEIIIHIVEVQIYIFTLLRSLLAEPVRYVPNWDEEIWTEKLNYHDENIDDWLQFFKLSNNIMLVKLKNLTYKEWTEVLVERKNGFKITLCDWLKYNCSHVEEHIEHMNEIYNLWLKNEAVQAD